MEQGEKKDTADKGYQRCPRLLSPILGRRLAQVPLDITAEIGWRGEVEHFGNVHETEAPVSQLAGNVQDREAVNPPVGRIAGNRLADFGEIFRSDA
jgi:hypothetical protein